MSKLREILSGAAAVTVAGCAFESPRETTESTSVIHECSSSSDVLTFTRNDRGAYTLILASSPGTDPAQAYIKWLSAEMDAEKVRRIMDEVCAGARDKDGFDIDDLQIPAGVSGP